MKKQTKRFAVLAAVVAVAALAALSSCFVVTQQNQYSVIRQFGKVVDVRTQPGISMKIPFIQQSSTIPNTMLLYDLPISDVITKDKKTMVADSFVLWRVDDPYRFIQNLNGQLSVAEDRLSTNVYNAMKNVISSKTQNLDACLAQRMISERNNIAASYTAEGESEATKIRSETDKEVEIMLSEAQAKAEALQAEGEAEYMRILSGAYADESRADFYTFVRALDAAKASLSGSNKTLFLDKSSPLVEVFYNEG